MKNDNVQGDNSYYGDVHDGMDYQKEFPWTCLLYTSDAADEHRDV